MKPRLLDLFCGAGGCTKGFQRAGFEVVGVDINPQPNYCGDDFVQMDALEFLRRLLKGERVAGYVLSDFVAIHASPPCQMYSRSMKHLSAPQPMLIDPVRELLVATGLPWVIENVEGAPIPRQNDLFGAFGVMLCGTSFGLRVYRHRLFESSFPIHAGGCDHRKLAMNPHNQAGRDLMYEEFGRADPEKAWRREMGVEWMGRYEAREAIPPVFTEHIGTYLMAELTARAAA
jgi:DNA (cytosine-5)-methyltransferase 1